MDKNLTLNQVQLNKNINNTPFLNAYEKLLINNKNELNENEIFLLLKSAVIFLNYGEEEIKKLGYGIILKYSNLFKDYLPLYDVSMEKDYIPVAKFIEDNYFNVEEIETSFNKLLMSSYKENFKSNRNENIYYSIGQKNLNSFSKNENDFVIVAPTSYGKSDLIISKVEENLGKNICIIVPTKSLLSQTKKNLIKNKTIRASNKKIISHPDMLDKVKGDIIAVLTQERLLRVLQKHTELKFDIVLIDEAHNLLGNDNNDNRDILTVQDLKILKKRNENTHFYYFTPFLANPENFKILSKEDILKINKITEYIKIEKYLIFNLSSGEKNLKIYDQFLNRFFNICQLNEINNEFDFINKYAASKNIIYINRPKKIEEFAVSVDNKIEINEEIQKVQDALKKFLHKDYNLIKTLENGVVYHHGGMPENVRLYVENAFSKIKNIKYVVTSSTLLQGVNIPAEKIFLLTTAIGRSNLNASQFKNLSGRVCRFNEVFDKKNGNLKMLEPEIYIIKSNNYSNKKSNIEKFLMQRVKDNLKIKDVIKNQLIKKNLDILVVDDFKKLKESEEYLENIEIGSSGLTNLRIVNSKIAQLCFKNNIHDFDIFFNEQQLQRNYESCKNIDPISNTNLLITLIVNIFIRDIFLNENTDNLKRLEETPTQKFYAMFLEWRASGKSYCEMINQFIWYWDKKPKINDKDYLIYVGETWGELPSPYYDKIGKLLYIDLRNKTEIQKINIAIIRIKEEQDFIDYRLIPYIEILNDLKLIEKTFYERIKYGTDDQRMIQMLKEGFSIELAKAIKDGNYNDYISFFDNAVNVTNGIIEEMKKNNENEILMFEIQSYINCEK